MTACFIALFIETSLIGLLFAVIFWLADRRDRTRRNRPAPVDLTESLPMAVAVATKFRRDRW